MKKILVTIALATLVAASTQAQGFVVFSSSTQNVSTNNTGVAQLGSVASGRIQGAGLYYFALFASATATSVGGTQTAAFAGTNGVFAFHDPNWTLVAYANSTATSGRWASTSADVNGANAVPGIAGGGSAQFVIVGWSIAGVGTVAGGTIAALQSALASGGQYGFIGQSLVSGTQTLGNGILIPTPSVSGGGSPGIPGFTLGSFMTVPEPGTLALAALGGASLLMFRRKK
jgi:hypothetical protein